MNDLNKTKKRALAWLFWVCLLLGATASTEYFFYRQDENRWAQDFEERLHRRERWADEVLETFRGEGPQEIHDGRNDVLFIGFRRGRIFYWTDEVVSDRNLYLTLTGNDRFMKLGNTYYEVRRKRQGECDYFALLKIKEVYPYNSPYVGDRFSPSLNIPLESTSEVTIHADMREDSHLIADYEGNGLFYLSYSKDYKGRDYHYALIALYLCFFLSLFYVYGLFLKSTRSWKKQLAYLLFFILFLIALRWFSIRFRLPFCVFRLPIFDTLMAEKMFVSSIGDLLLLTFSVFSIVYITLPYIRINYASSWLRRHRYLMTAFLLTLVFWYVDLYNFAIDLAIANMDVHLNIAQIVLIDVPSLIIFIAILLGGVVILLGLFGVASWANRLLPFKGLLWLLSATCLVLWLVSLFANLYTNHWDCLFIWSVTMLFAVYKYFFKHESWRSIYLIAIFILSVYVVMTTEKYERYKEQRQRLEYATGLIEERDYHFEKRLKDFDRNIIHSDVLFFFLEGRRHQQAEDYMREKLLDLRAYNYYTNLTFCRRGNLIFLPGSWEPVDCQEYFDRLIRRFGSRVGDTHFYTIRIFDGIVTYIGRFEIANTLVYLRFDSAREDEGVGYSKILSRRSGMEHLPVYDYSIAKYQHRNLVYSQGDFVYSKRLKPWSENRSAGVEIVTKEHYSHMLIAVDDDNTLIISLPERIFALYYLNVLYAFLLCVLLSSYGLFYVNGRRRARIRGTLKARIRNSVIWLIFILLVFLSTLSIYFSTKSFEKRHKAKAIEFLKYVNKELERLDCVDWSECPTILQTLSNISHLLLVDINIYSSSGELVATSRPEIFQLDFRGFLINPKALREIIGRGSTSYIEQERIGELKYMSVYMPLVLDRGKTYVLNVPYFAQNREFNIDVVIMIVITVNIAIVMMVVAFILSGVLAERVTKPLQMVNDKLRKMRLGGKNEKVDYKEKDEIGELVREYNTMVEQLDESVVRLARSERESAWREMARQIAHEIKNPLTPMKLNIQFMMRTIDMEDTDKFKQRFRSLSGMLIEQIDNMAATASAFSDFAKISLTRNEVLKLDEVLRNCIMLFDHTIADIRYEGDPDLAVFADREQMRRVIVNLLKNAGQSIPEGRPGKVDVTLREVGGRVEVRIRDNGCGVPEEIRERIFEPNFTTKTSGSGLGLALCHRIIQNFGGEIGFSTELGVGTEFYFLLDRHQEPDA